MTYARSSAAVAACAALSAFGLLTGCAPEAVLENRVPSPVLSPSATARVVLPPVGKEVAAGELTGDARGKVEVKFLGKGNYSVRLTGLVAHSTEGLRVHLGANRRVFNCAGVSGTNLDLGAATASSTQEFTLRKGYAPNAEEDPSFLRAVALVASTDQYDSEDCAARTPATAQLTWTLPNTRPDLKVEDGRARAGAQGPVRLQNGHPVDYEVATNDTMQAIADRFNITVQDIFYLNPQRGIGNDPEAKRGETLNLTRATR